MEFLALLDEIIPLVARERRLPVTIFELYRIAVYDHLGAIDQVRQMIASLLQFLETERGLWSAIFLGHVIRVHIQSGHLETAEEFLEKIKTDFDTKSYLIPLAPQLPQIRAEMALA